MNESPYPREMCIAPPLKSELVDECGENCKGTVTMINDMSSDMHGRPKLIDKLKDDFKILLFNNRGHYNVTYDDHGNPMREGDDGSALDITRYMPDHQKCKEQYNIDPYVKELFVEDVRRMMNKHGVKKSHLVGFSLGSFIAQGFANKYPERTDKVVIGKAFTRYHDYVRTAKSVFSGPIFQGAYWVWCNARTKLNPNKNYGCNVPLSIVNQYAKHVLDMDLTKDQLGIESPTLVIECADDFAFGEPVNKIKNAERKKIMGCGHVLHMQNHEMYGAVEEFLKR